MLFKYFEKVAVVVCPQTYAHLGIQRARVSQFFPLKSGCRGSNQNPSCAENIGIFVVLGVDHARDLAEGGGFAGEHRLQIQIAIGDMYRENSVGLKVMEIE